MGHRFSNFKDRMRSEAQIKIVEEDIAENEAFLTANPDAPTHQLRMLKAALVGMIANLAELQQAHKKRFRRRFTR